MKLSTDSPQDAADGNESVGDGVSSVATSSIHEDGCENKDLQSVNSQDLKETYPVREQQMSPFFALPSETRNMIMRYVVVPGAVHLRNPKDQFRQSSDFHFLATCRQAYREGHILFYSLNTFYLPPGSLEHNSEYFTLLRPGNDALIRHVGTRNDFEDAVGKMLTDIDHEGSNDFPRDFSHTSNEQLTGNQERKSLFWYQGTLAKLHSVWKHILNRVVNDYSEDMGDVYEDIHEWKTELYPGSKVAVYRRHIRWREYTWDEVDKMTTTILDLLIGDEGLVPYTESSGGFVESLREGKVLQYVQKRPILCG